jgi:lipopolysaccharide transport system permease protein
VTWRYVASRDADAPFVQRLLSTWQHRALLVRMSERDVRLRYAGSSLGRVWAVVYPLLLVAFYAAIFTFVFRGRLGQDDQSPQRYALYVISGLLPWLSITEVATRAVQTMAEHRGLVKHVMFPVQILPLTGVYAAVLPQAVGLIALIAFASWVGNGFTAQVLTLGPVVILHLLLLAGVAWLLGAIGALLRDVRELLTIALTAGMFATPIFYTEQDAPALLRLVLNFNPITHLLNAYRDALLGGPPRHPESLPILAAIAVITLAIGFWTFERTRVTLADIL